MEVVVREEGNEACVATVYLGHKWTRHWVGWWGPGSVYVD